MSDQEAETSRGIADDASASVQGLTLAQAEQIDNPIVGRIIADMKARLTAKGDPSRRSASHNSHASSPGGKGHTSYVTGRFEDS